MKQKLLKLAPKVLVMAALMLASLGYGYLCGIRHLPGYSMIRRAHIWAVDQPVIRKVYSLATGRHRENRMSPTGAWNVARNPTTPQPEDHHGHLDKLLTVPYLSGYKKAPTVHDVAVYVDEFAYHGVNLYTSGHAPEAVLMDMTGRVLHQWTKSYADAFPHNPAPKGPKTWGWWSRVSLDPSAGDLYAIYDGYGLVKLDKHSNVIWASPGAFHHDLFVDSSGVVYALTKKQEVLPRIHPYEPVIEDFITVVDRNGRIVRNVSLLEAHENSQYAAFLENMPEFGDLMHTNTVEAFDGSHADTSPLFREGNVLVSFAMIDEIAIVDMDKEEVVWALTGQWNRQHNPTLLDNGDILLVDNLWHRDASRVIEINPFTQAIAWSYEGTPEHPYFTKTFGTNQRLPNGNTLINESNSGHAFEVTPSGEVVWEFYNPARTGNKHELIATLFDFQRLTSETASLWVARPIEETERAAGGLH